jgi:hypothetical protein
MNHISDTAVETTSATQDTPIAALTPAIQDLLTLQEYLEQQYPDCLISIRQVSEKDITTKRTVLMTRKIVCILIFLSFFASMDAKNKYTKNTDILLQKSMKNGIFVADTEPILFISTLTILPNANIKEARGFLLTPEKVVWQVAGCVQFTEAVVLVSYEKDCTRYETLEGTYILWKGRKVLDYCPMECETFTRYALV